MWSGVEDDDTRLFRFIHLPEERAALGERHFLPRFSQVAFIVQMPHMNLEGEMERLKGSALTDADKKEIAIRAACAKFWLLKYAAEEFKFTLQSTLPESVSDFSSEQKTALRKIHEYVQSNETLLGENLHTTLHEIRKESGLDAKTFFGAIYQSFLAKDSGPKAGWFLSVLDRAFLLKRLAEASK
jgi:lysyl-tRNA synthetase class 1